MVCVSHGAGVYAQRLEAEERQRGLSVEHLAQHQRLGQRVHPRAEQTAGVAGGGQQRHAQVPGGGTAGQGTETECCGLMDCSAEEKKAIS